MIRIGVIGAGPNGTGNAAALAKHADRCRIAGVADIDPAAGQKLAAAHGAQCYRDYREMLNWVDAVVISTPNDLHAEMAIAAAGAGKHVWIEKPMALSLTQADRIVTAVTTAGVASMVGFSVRFDGIVRRMKEVYASGQLGELLSIWSRRLCFFDPAAVTPWRLEYPRSGGVMSELIVHEIDWIVDIAGDPTAVYCRKASRKRDDHRDNDHLWITLAFGKGATGSIEGSQMSLIADYYRGVVGSAGSAATRNWGGELYLQTDPKTATKLEPLPAFDKHGHFLDVIEGRCESLADVRYGHKIVRISEKAIKSAMSGVAVELQHNGVARMKTSINGCLWGGYEQWKGIHLTVEEYFAQVAEAGYEGIELGGGREYLGTPRQCLERAAKFGLEISSYCTSVTYNPYPPNTKAYQQDMDYAADLGVSMLMVCGGFLPFGRRNTYGYDYDMFAGNFGRAVKYAARHGQTLAFHPHVGSIVETIAETEEMVRRLSGFALCVDIAHLARAGADAVQFIRRFRKRIVHTHIKDYSLKHNAFIELGKGDTLDVAACVRELEKVGYDGWLCVELDRPKSEFERLGKTALQSAKACRRYLKNKCGV